MAALVRLGLIGVGRWGKVYIWTILSLGERCRITHLGTRNPENATLLPYPVNVMSDWRRLIESDCDAIIIATPPSTHAEIVEACLEARKPCMVEKPFCLDVATAERLHEQILAFNVPVLVNHTQLFNPAYQALRRALLEAGEPVRVILSEGMGLGPFRSDVSALWDWGPHDVSLCVDLLGQVPLHVAALGGPTDPRGAPELVSVRLDFPGGACAWIQAGRLSPSKRRHFSVFTDTQLYVLDDLATEKLTVSPIDFSRREADGIADVLEKYPISSVSAHSPMENAVRYFLDGLAGGDRRYFNTELALDVVRLLAKCEEALRGESVRAAAR